MTLHHKQESDGFDYWVTGWGATGSSALCIADPFVKLCSSAADLPADRLTVYSEGGSFYPRLILVAPTTVSSVVAVFADGSSSAATFKRVGTLDVAVAVVRYPAALAGSDVRLRPSIGDALSWRLPQPPADEPGAGLPASSGAEVANSTPQASPGPSVPAGMLRPSAAAPVDGTG